MAATFPHNGRAITIKRGDTPAAIAGVRTKSIKINGEPIDITNDDDSGWKTLMDMPAETSVEISVAGIAKDDTLLSESLDEDDRVAPTEFGLPGATPGKIAGDFFLSSYTRSGEYKGAATFEATFVSTGSVAYTAPA